MSGDVVRLRNVGTQELRIEGASGDVVVAPGDVFATDRRTATIVARVARVEVVTETPPVPSPIVIPVGARTAGARS